MIKMLDALTGFRFVAALAVFASHLSFLKEYDFTKAVYENYFHEGYVGVTFFFVLSGFILTYNYYGKLSTLSPREVFLFYTARIARIYPVHILTFLIGLVFSYKNVLHNPSAALINLFLLQSFSLFKKYIFRLMHHHGVYPMNYSFISYCL